MEFDMPVNYFSEKYLQLVEHIKLRSFENQVTQKHHIFPVSIYGSNDVTVITDLKHHIIFHYLIMRAMQVAYGSDDIRARKASFAFNSMTGNMARHGKEAAAVLREYLAKHSGYTLFRHSDISKEKNRQAHRGRKCPESQKIRLKEALTGIKRSAETRARMSAAQKSRQPPSPETRELMSKASLQKWNSAEYAEKQRVAHTGHKQSAATVAKRLAAIEFARAADPSFAERYKYTEERRLRRSENQKKLWQDPEYRARMKKAHQKSLPIEESFGVDDISLLNIDISKLQEGLSCTSCDEVLKANSEAV